MDGAKLHAKILKGYGKAAKLLGTQFYVYRSNSMIAPTDKANKIAVALATFTTGMDYATYNKPSVPFWTAMVDQSGFSPGDPTLGIAPDALAAGDWLSDGARTFYIAEIQPLLPIPAIECTAVVSIERAGYGTDADGGLSPEAITTIATGLPVFMFSKKDKSAAPPWFPASTSSVDSLPEHQLYINARNVGDVQVGDVVIDELGLRYHVTTASRTGWGYIVTAKLEKP